MMMEIHQIKQVTDLTQYKTAHLDVANRMTVSTPVEAVLASSVLVEIARVKKDLEARRKSLVDPINKHVRWINVEAKKISEPLEEADRIIRGKVSSYRQTLRQAEETDRAVATQLGAEEWLPDVSRPDTVRVDGGKVGSRMRWTFEVVDPNAIPRQYLVLDEKRVRGAIQSGIREILGLNIHEEEILVVGAT